MFKKHPLLSYLKFSVFAAIAYSLSAMVYLQLRDFTQSWVLYIGNLFFGAGIVFFLFYFNKKKKGNANAGNMIVAGHIATVLATIIACILVFILLACLVPGIFIGHSIVLQNAPPQTFGNTRHELMIQLFANAAIGNICVGFFVAVLFGSGIKKDQTAETNN
jgi:hypothetical protein